MAKIAPTAVVDKTAQLGQGVTVGPGCVIGPGVVIGDGCELKANVFIAQGTTIGKNNRVFAGAVLGEEPQSLGLHDPQTELIIGDNNILREYVTIHRGTPDGGGRTIVGNNNFLMVSCHLGHDCEVEDNVVMINNCHIGGHNKIECNAWLSGGTFTNQFLTIGRFAFTGGFSGPGYDVPPFVRVVGVHPCEVRGLNLVGLERGGFSQESVKALGKACRRLYRKREGKSIVTITQEMLSQDGLDENVRYLLESLERSSKQRFGRYRELARK